MHRDSWRNKSWTIHGSVNTSLPVRLHGMAKSHTAKYPTQLKQDGSGQHDDFFSGEVTWEGKTSHGEISNSTKAGRSTAA